MFIYNRYALYYFGMKPFMCIVAVRWTSHVSMKADCGLTKMYLCITSEIFWKGVMCLCVLGPPFVWSPFFYSIFWKSPQICYVPTRCLGGRGSNTVKLRELSKKRKRQTKQIASLKEVYLKWKRDKGPPTKNELPKGHWIAFSRDTQRKD